MVSTPTVHGISRIEKEFESSDKRYFFVPCPHCNYYQVLKWPQIKWEEKNPATAHYVCIECRGEIKNHQKTEMLARGEWRATREEGKKEAKEGAKIGLYIKSKSQGYNEQAVNWVD